VISCEPAELMYIQQGLMRLLYETIETQPLTAGQVNFTDQTINRKLAERGSRDGGLCTIDLSDASDRVSLDLVRRVFPPNWVRCLEACRSEETILPDQSIVKLNKFAPMGSSCCFPVEALVFWACAQAAIDTRRGVRPLQSGLNHVYVYGDDIITDSFYYESVVEGLELVGLKVNKSKSYAKGPFRESCGGDFHNGMDVTPVRVRKFFSSQGTGLATTADLFNSLLNKFGCSALPLIRDLECEVGYVYPRTMIDLPMSIRFSPGASNDVFFRRRWNKNLQRLEHRTMTLVSEVLTKHPPNWGELLRKELSRGLPSAGKYQNPLAIVNSVLEPGQYADTHTVRKQWVWTWLG